MKSTVRFVSSIKMSLVFVICLMVVGAMAAPETLLRPTPPPIPALERTELHQDSGEFSLLYRSGDGTVVSEIGVLKPTLDGKDKVLVKEGEYSFISDDGKVYRTKYVADEKGFRAEGEHLPKSVIA